MSLPRPDLGGAIRWLLADARRRIAAGREAHLPARCLGEIAAGRPPEARESEHLAVCLDCTADVVDLAGDDSDARGRGG